MWQLLVARPLFRRLWLAGAVSQVGDWLSLVAVSTLVVRAGGGALGLAVVLAAHAAPGVLAAPLAGVLADRLDRRTLLVAANTVNAALTALMVAAAALDSPAAVQALLLVRAAAAALVQPAEAAALRRVVAEGELLQANAVLTTTWSVGFVVGMAAGGLLAAIGPVVAIALDAGSFVLAAALLLTLPSLAPPGRPVPLARVLRGVPADLADALRFAASRVEVRRALAAKSLVALAGGAGWIALNVVAGEQRPFVDAAISLGVLQAIRGAGTGVGPALVARLRGGSAHVGAILAGSIALGVGGAVLLPLSGSVPLLGLAAFVWGLGSGTGWVVSSVELQRLGGESRVGRLVALDELLATLAMVGSGFAGALAARGSGTVAATSVVGLSLAAAGWILVERVGRRSPRVARREAAGGANVV